MAIKSLQSNCSLCGYEISNPTCVDCLKKQVFGFLGRRDHISQDMEENMQLFECFDTDKASCIFCDNSVSICSYCFYREIYKALKKFDMRLAAEFSRLFQCSGEIQTYLNHYFSLYCEDGVCTFDANKHFGVKKG